MIKYAGYAITFQEVPDEISLVLTISNCPNHCDGCHSPWLREDIGDDLEKDLPGLLRRYGDAITCVCFMGTGKDDDSLARCVIYAHDMGFKTAVYSGDEEAEAYWVWKLPSNLPDYAKFGPYVSTLGGLDSVTTNQKMYQYNCHTNKYEDITYRFWNRRREH